MLEVLGYKVQSLGCRVEGKGFRVLVTGSGFRI
jgi:hypothetical protein